MFIAFLHGKERTGYRMPSWGQILPYVLRWCQRATDGGACGASRITLVVRLAARVSNRSLTWARPAGILPFFMRGGALPAHDSLVANHSHTPQRVLRVAEYERSRSRSTLVPSSGTIGQP